MLVIPETFRQGAWIGIDPGLATCGISIFRLQERQLTSIEAFTIVNQQIPLISEYPEEYQTERAIKMNLLCLAYQEVLNRVNPFAVCCESPFYNPRMPSAYGSLMETVTALRLQTTVNPLIPFIMFSPQEVKQTFKRSGQTGKTVMRESLQENSFLMSKLVTPLELLDEHAVDAIAVGHSGYKVWFGE